MGRKDVLYRKKGYTAIEMLVVVAIITIVAGILMPMLKGARDRAKRSSCANNLRQLSMAISMYIQDDNLERFPGYAGQPENVENLPGLLYRYLGEGNQNAYWSGELEVFNCPANNSLTDIADRTDASGNVVDYVYNPQLIEEPAPQVVDNPLWLAVLADYLPEDGIHSGGTNVLFYDGHVKWLDQGEINETHDGATGIMNWGLK